MTLKQNGSLQFLLTAFQGVNWATLPHKVQLYAGFAAAVVQAFIAWRAHNFNTDGTHQSIAHDPAKTGELNLQ